MTSPNGAEIYSGRNGEATRKRPLVSGVTAENFVDLGRNFMGPGHGTGFVISLRPWLEGGEQRPATVAQWGAWRAWRKARGLPVAFMDQRARAGEKFTVPAEWPHLFDAEATVTGDHAAGDAFAANYRPERIDLADAATRLAQAAAWRKRRFTAEDAEWEIAP